jgi:hypothetical protein
VTTCARTDCSREAHGAEPHPDLCYTDAKEAAGLYRCGARVSANAYASCWLPEGHRGHHSMGVQSLHGLLPGHMVSDEAEAIMGVLRSVPA